MDAGARDCDGDGVADANVITGTSSVARLGQTVSEGMVTSNGLR